MEAMEFEIDTFGEFEGTYETEGNADGTLFVVVENLDGPPLEHVEVVTLVPGEGGGVRADSDGFAVASEPEPDESLVSAVELNGEMRGAIQAFAGDLPAQATHTQLRIHGTENRRVRVFVGWVKGFWPNTPCDKCKAIVKAVIRVMRAAGGDVGIDDLAGSILRFLSETLGERAIGILRDILALPGAIGRAVDWIATKVCQRLGYCP